MIHGLKINSKNVSIVKIFCPRFLSDISDLILGQVCTYLSGKYFALKRIFTIWTPGAAP
jgi:hypothetical protein